MLVTVGVAVGLASVVDDKDGPLHAYTVAVADGLVVRVTVPPTHIGPLFVGAAVGVGLTLTSVVYIVAGLQPDPAPLLTVSEYVVVTVGVAVGLASVAEDKLAPLQEYIEAPPDGFANKLTVPPLQIVPLFVGAAVGDGLTVTTVT